MEGVLRPELGVEVYSRCAIFARERGPTRWCGRCNRGVACVRVTRRRGSHEGWAVKGGGCDSGCGRVARARGFGWSSREADEVATAWCSFREGVAPVCGSERWRRIER